MIITKQYRVGPNLVTREEHSEGGVWHREDGPALICSHGVEAWYLNGQLHREDGPAIVDGLGYKAWFIHGVKTRVEHNSGVIYDPLAQPGTEQEFPKF